MRNTSLDITPKDRSTAFLILGFLLACYLLTFTGRIDSSDGLSMVATTENLVRTGAIDNNQLLWMGNQQGNIGVDGDLYSRKGLGMVILGAPFVWLARQWAAVGMVQAALLLNPILTAWTGALIFRAGRRLRWRRGEAIATALLFGLATMVWPYTQGYFSDPVCAWGLLAAAYGMLAYAQSGRKLYLFGAGVAWSIAYLTRTINLVTLPIYAVGLFWALDAITRPETGRWRERLEAAFWRNWRPVVAFLIPVIAAGVLSLWWNWARFGNIWDSGYVSTETFSANWLEGLFGLTIGPARGFFWYNPILVLAIPGSIWFWRHQRRLLFLVLALVALYFLMYAKWYMWHGGYSWGPRFLVPVVPFLALLAGPGWYWLTAGVRWRVMGRIIAGVLAAVSVGVQLLGLFVPFSLAQDWLASSVQPLFAPETFIQPALSPLVLQWQFLTGEHIQFVWWRNVAWPDSIAWFGLLIPLSGVVVGLWLLIVQIRRPESDDHDDHVRNWLYAGALIAITLATLTYAQALLADSESALVSGRIADLERPGDAVLLLQPEKTQDFQNEYRGSLPVYGFFNREQLAGDEMDWLNRITNRYQRLWVAPNYLGPDQSGWEGPLRTEHYVLIDERVSGPNNQRIALYALAPAQNLIESGLGTIFGDPSSKDPVTDANGWIRLSGYALTSETQPGMPS
ncbi:MAG: hypothetical protein IPK16_27645 [Anaerolineales bacterium]|nr:hypothetical protein [Anaerolineales bacterium]